MVETPFSQLELDVLFYLRAASPKYRLNQEIAKKWNFFKLAQNEVFRALVTKIIV